MLDDTLGSSGEDVQSITPGDPELAQGDDRKEDVTFDQRIVNVARGIRKAGFTIMTSDYDAWVSLDEILRSAVLRNGC